MRKTKEKPGSIIIAIIIGLVLYFAVSNAIGIWINDAVQDSRLKRIEKKIDQIER